MRGHLIALRDAFESLSAFTAPDLEAALRGLAEQRAVKAAALIHATRVAVTGKSVSPGLFEVIELLGRERTASRMTAAAALAAP
jgi:glutamyl/glutaminyl-tRNA synthetase